MFLAMIAFARMGAEAGLFYNSGSAGFLEEALGTSGLAPKSAPTRRLFWRALFVQGCSSCHFLNDTSFI